MSRWLREQHVKMIFVRCPIRPGNLVDSSVRAKVWRHIQICDSIVGAGGGTFLNYYNGSGTATRFFSTRSIFGRKRVIFDHYDELAAIIQPGEDGERVKKGGPGNARGGRVVGERRDCGPGGGGWRSADFVPAGL